jgi:hypothetical protein
MGMALSFIVDRQYTIKLFLPPIEFFPIDRELSLAIAVVRPLRLYLAPI